MSEHKYPTEIIELPSKGLVYPEGHPLKSGKVEMKYMTAKEEDILSNSNFIDKGIVFDKLLSSLTFNKFPVDDILPGDKNALLIAARILGIGAKYEFEYRGEPIEVDLSTIDNKPFDGSLISETGTATFKLPSNDTEIEFKFLTEKEQNLVDEEVKGMAKFTKGNTSNITTQLKHTIVSINGNPEKSEIKSFSEYVLATDSRALRKYISNISPDADFTFETPSKEEVAIPITISFLWPEL